MFNTLKKLEVSISSELKDTMRTTIIFPRKKRAILFSPTVRIVTHIKKKYVHLFMGPLQGLKIKTHKKPLLYSFVPLLYSFVPLLYFNF